MNDPRSIIKWLGKRGIVLKVRDGKLLAEGDKDKLTPEIVERLKPHKQALMEYLWPTKPRVATTAKTCPAGDIECKAHVIYPDRDGDWCAYTAQFEHRAGRPLRVRRGSSCPRENHIG